MSPPRDPAVNAQIEHLLNEGEPLNQVARIVGRNKSSVTQLAKKHGWPTNKIIGAKTRHDIQNAWLSGLTVEQLSALYGQAESRIAKVIANVSLDMGRFSGETTTPVSRDDQGPIS